MLLRGKWSYILLAFHAVLHTPSRAGNGALGLRRRVTPRPRDGRDGESGSMGGRTAAGMGEGKGGGTGSEERRVLGVGSIPFAILPSSQGMKTIAL